MKLSDTTSSLHPKIQRSPPNQVVNQTSKELSYSHHNPKRAARLSITMMRRTILHIPRTANRALTTSTRPSLFSPIVSRPAPLLSTKRHYHEKVLDHYSNPRNVGSMQKADTDVGTGLVGAPACGDVMKLQIRVDDKTNTISDVKFKTFGCGSAIASSSYLTELVRGMTLEQAGKVRNTEIAKELCLPPVKRKSCSYLSRRKAG
jgi:iron-sulfur cluster assembly enzyme ISCU, mitochondrial